MPDTAINTAQPLRLEQGGLLKIVDGATTYELQNREKGTLQIKDGWYAPLRYNNKGEMQVPVEGDEQPSTGRFTLKLTSFDSAQAATLAQQRDTTTGKLKTYSLEVHWPDYKGAATGHKATIANAYLVEGIDIQEGQEFDTVTFAFESSEPKWTIIGY